MKYTTLCTMFLLSLLFLIGCTTKGPQFYVEKLVNATIEKDFDTVLRYYLVWQIEIAKNPKKLEMYQARFARQIKGNMRLKSIEIQGEPTIEEEIEDGEVLKYEKVTFKVVIELDGEEETDIIPLIKVTKEMKRKFPGLQSKVGEWAVALQ